jgi:hypothetical protein
VSRSTLRYRVNFGNGQVHYPGDKRACFRYIGDPANDCGGYAFVEWQDPETGDWFRTGLEHV